MIAAKTYKTQLFVRDKLPPFHNWQFLKRKTSKQWMFATTLRALDFATSSSRQRGLHERLAALALPTTTVTDRYDSLFNFGVF